MSQEYPYKDTCEVCNHQEGPDFRVYRVNPKGETGRFRCLKDYDYIPPKVETEQA